MIIAFFISILGISFAWSAPSPQAIPSIDEIESINYIPKPENAKDEQQGWFSGTMNSISDAVSNGKTAALNGMIDSAFTPATANMVLKNLDLEGRLLSYLRGLHDSVQKYYPCSEKDSFNAMVSAQYAEGIKQAPTWKNDADVKSAVAQIIHNIGSNVVFTILANYSVTPEQQLKWSNRLLSPFDQCSKKARTLSQVFQCEDDIDSFIAQNVGLAITYELVRTRLLPSAPSQTNPRNLTLTATNHYKACILLRVKQHPAADSKNDIPTGEINSCVLQAFEDGLLRVADDTVVGKLKGQIKDSKKVDRITAGLLSSTKNSPHTRFQACLQSIQPGTKSSQNCRAQTSLQKGGYDDEIFRCVNHFTVEVTPPVAKEIILNSEPLKTSYSAKELESLGNSAEQDFNRCFAGAKARQGNLSAFQAQVAQCSDKVTQHLTQLIAPEIFRKETATKLQLPLRDQQVSNIVSSAQQSLVQCLPRAGGTKICLRSATADLVVEIASNVLDHNLKVQPLDPEFKRELLKDFKSCLLSSDGLPSDIAGTPSVGSFTEKCSNRLTLETAEGTLRSRFQKSFGGPGKLSAGEMDELIREVVTSDFRQCMTADFSEKGQIKCVLKAVSKASNHAGKLLLPRGLDSALSGVSTETLTSEQVDQFKSRQVLNFSDCLEHRVSEKSPDVQTASESCFKDQILADADFITLVKFNDSTKSLYTSKQDRQKTLRQKAQGEMKNCLGNIKSQMMESFLKDVHDCGEKVSKAVTISVAEDQVTSAVNQHLPESQREKVLAEVLTPFHKCVEVKADMSCEYSLTRNAQEAIVLAVSDNQIQQNLKGKEVPDKFAKIRSRFKSCTRDTPAGEFLRASLDACSRTYILEISKELGPISANQSLQKALGERGTVQAAPLIRAALQNYRACVDGFEGKTTPLDDFYQELQTTCVVNLRSDGIKIAQDYLGKSLRVEGDSAAQSPANESRRLLSEFVPCLSNIMADGTGEIENSQGTLDGLANILGQYVDYDPTQAHRNIKVIIEKLGTDMGVLPNIEARKELSQLLVERGVFEQLVKAMSVRATADAIHSLKDPKQRSVLEPMIGRLTNRAQLDSVFRSPEGKAIIKFGQDQILNPILIQGKGSNDPSIVSAYAEMKDRVAGHLARSQQFGGVILDQLMKNEMKQLSLLDKVGAFFIGGSKALNWCALRNTPGGVETVFFLKEKILVPYFQGILRERQLATLKQEASGMIEKAMAQVNKMPVSELASITQASSACN